MPGVQRRFNGARGAVGVIGYNCPARLPKAFWRRFAGVYDGLRVSGRMLSGCARPFKDKPRPPRLKTKAPAFIQGLEAFGLSGVRLFKPFSKSLLYNFIGRLSDNRRAGIVNREGQNKRPVFPSV